MIHRKALHGTRAEFLEILNDAKPRGLSEAFVASAAAMHFERIQEIKSGKDPKPQEVAALFVGVYGQDAPPITPLRDRHNLHISPANKPELAGVS
jgi:hypothetical protein